MIKIEKVHLTKDVGETAFCRCKHPQRSSYHNIQKPKDDPYFLEISGLQKKSSGSGAAGRPANKKKTTKVEGQPKRPSSAYFIWMNEVRAEIKAELPSEASIGDISKFAGERWKSMTDDNKKVS